MWVLNVKTSKRFVLLEIKWQFTFLARYTGKLTGQSGTISVKKQLQVSNVEIPLAEELSNYCGPQELPRPEVGLHCWCTGHQMLVKATKHTTLKN